MDEEINLSAIIENDNDYSASLDTDKDYSANLESDEEKISASLETEDEYEALLETENEYAAELESEEIAVTTSDYNQLQNKPTLDGVTIQGAMKEKDPTVPEWIKVMEILSAAELAEICK